MCVVTLLCTKGVSCLFLLTMLTLIMNTYPQQQLNNMLTSASISLVLYHAEPLSVLRLAVTDIRWIFGGWGGLSIQNKSDFEARWCDKPVDRQPCFGKRAVLPSHTCHDSKHAPTYRNFLFFFLTLFCYFCPLLLHLY